MAKRSDLEPLIIQAWLEYLPAGDRAEGNVILFYGWLTKHRPELLSFLRSETSIRFLRAYLESKLSTNVRWQLQPG